MGWSGIDTELDQGANLDRAVGVLAEPLRPFHGLVERIRLDQVVGAEHLLRLGERPVDDHSLATAASNRARLRGRSERRAGDKGAPASVSSRWNVVLASTTLCHCSGVSGSGRTDSPYSNSRYLMALRRTS